MQQVSEYFWTTQIDIWGATVSGTTLTAPTLQTSAQKCTGIVPVDPDYQPQSNPKQFKRFFKVYFPTDVTLKEGYVLKHDDLIEDYVVHEIWPYPVINPVYHKVIVAILN